MSQNRRQRVAAGQRPDTGSVHNREYRTVQNPGDGKQVSINLTDFGRKLHGLESGDNLAVDVCENGIWISTDE